MKICNLWMKSRLFGREVWNWMESCEIHVKLAQISGKIISKNKFIWRPLFVSIDFLCCTLHVYQDWNVAWCFSRLKTILWFLLCFSTFVHHYIRTFIISTCGRCGLTRLRWKRGRLFSHTSKTQSAWCRTHPTGFFTWDSYTDTIWHFRGLEQFEHISGRIVAMVGCSHGSVHRPFTVWF